MNERLAAIFAALAQRFAARAARLKRAREVKRLTCDACGVWRIDGSAVYCPVKRARALRAVLVELAACDEHTPGRDALNPAWAAEPPQPWPWSVAEAAHPSQGISERNTSD
jgi:hypothetical protein